jgi:hypothetical protein
MASHDRIAPLRTSHPISTGWMVALVVLTLVSGFMATWTYLRERPAASTPLEIGENISSCIHKYYAGGGSQNSNVLMLSYVGGFCYNSQVWQLILEEEAVRRDNFVFQRAENVALLAMVIGITISGVALAGLQLFASYKLASIGTGQLADGGEATFKSDSVVVKSSVVGVVILAISFAFFIVFVLYVYTLRDGGAPGPARSRESAESNVAGVLRQSNMVQTPPSLSPTTAPQFNLNPVSKVAPRQSSPTVNH